eukprot:COSAG01_NODE_56375_length_318_cov_41.726027_1_plen_62_part_10
MKQTELQIETNTNSDSIHHIMWPPAVFESYMLLMPFESLCPLHWAVVPDQPMAQWSLRWPHQ